MKGIEEIIIAIVFIIVVCLIIYFLYNTLIKEEHITPPPRNPDEFEVQSYITGDVQVRGYIKNNKTYIYGRYRDTITGDYKIINDLPIEEDSFEITDVLYADQYKLNYIQLGSYSFLESINSSLIYDYGTTPIAIISNYHIIYNKDHPVFDNSNSVVEALSDGGNASMLHNVEMKFFSSGTWGQNCSKNPETIKYPNYQTISSNGVFNINYLDIDYNNDISEANIAINEVDSCSNCKSVPGFDFDINPNKVGCVNVYTKCMDINQNIKFGLINTRVMVPYYDRSTIDESDVGGAGNNKYNFGLNSNLNNNLHPCGTGVYTEYGDINHNKKEWDDISNDFLNEIDQYGFGVIVNISDQDLNNRLLKYNLNINSFIPVLTNKFDGSFYFDINLSPNIIQRRSDGGVVDIPMSRFKCYLAKFYNLYSNELNNQFVFKLDVTDLGGYYENRKLTLERNENQSRLDIRINVNPMLLNIIDNIDINDDIDNISYIPGSQNYFGSYGHHILNKIPLFKIEILNSNNKTQISNLQNRRSIPLFGPEYDSDQDVLFGVLLRITLPNVNLIDDMIFNKYSEYFNDLTSEQGMSTLGYTVGGSSENKIFKNLTDGAFNEDWIHRSGGWPGGYRRDDDWEKNLLEAGTTPDESDQGYYAFAEGDGNSIVKPVLSNLLNIKTFNEYLNSDVVNIYGNQSGVVDNLTFIKLFYGLVIPMSRLKVYDETSRLNDIVADEESAQGVTVLDVDKETYLEFLYSKEDATTYQDVFNNTNIKKYYNYTIRSQLPITQADFDAMMTDQAGAQWSFAFFKTIKTEYKFKLEDILRAFEIKWHWNNKGKADLGVYLKFKQSPSATLNSSESGNKKSVWGWINDDKLKNFSWTVSRVKLTLIQTHYWGTQFLPLLTSSQKPVYPSIPNEPDDPHKIPYNASDDNELQNVWDRQWQTVKTYFPSGMNGGGRVIELSHDLNSNVKLIQENSITLVEFSGIDSNLTAGQYIIDKLSVDIQPVVPPAKAMQTTKLAVSFETEEIDISTSTINFTELDAFSSQIEPFNDNKINFVYEPFDADDFQDSNNIKFVNSEYYYTESYTEPYHTQKQILTLEGIPDNLERNNILRRIKIESDNKDKILFDTGPLTTQVCIDKNKTISSSYMSTIRWGLPERSFNISLSYTRDGDGGNYGLFSDKEMGCENRITRNDLGDRGDYLDLASFLCTFGKGQDEYGYTTFVDPIKNGIDNLDIDINPIVVRSDSLNEKSFGGIPGVANTEIRHDIICGEGNYQEYNLNEFSYDASGGEDLFLRKQDHYCQIGGTLLCKDTNIAITNNLAFDACSDRKCIKNLTDNDWRWRLTGDDPPSLGGAPYSHVLKNLKNLYSRVTSSPDQKNAPCYSNNSDANYLCDNRIGKPNKTIGNDSYRITQPVPDKFQNLQDNYFENVRDMIKHNCFSTYTKMHQSMWNNDNLEWENGFKKVNFRCLNKKGEPWGTFEPWKKIHEGFNTYLADPNDNTGGNLGQPYVHIQGVTNGVNLLHKKIYKNATGGCALKIFDEPGFNMALQPDYMYGNDRLLDGKQEQLKTPITNKTVDPITKAIFEHKNIRNTNPNDPIKFKDTINANDFFYNFVNMQKVDDHGHYNHSALPDEVDIDAVAGGYFNNYLTKDHDLLKNESLITEINKQMTTHKTQYGTSPPYGHRYRYLDEDYDGSQVIEGEFITNSPEYYLSHNLRYKINHALPENKRTKDDIDKLIAFNKGIKMGNLFGWLNDYYDGEDSEWPNLACCLGGEYTGDGGGCKFDTQKYSGVDNHHQNQLNMYINTISTKGKDSKNDNWRNVFDGAADLGAMTGDGIGDTIKFVAPGYNYVIKQGTDAFDPNIEKGLYNKPPEIGTSLKERPQSLDPGIIENLSTKENTYYNFVDTFLLDIGDNINVNISKTGDPTSDSEALPARSYFQSDIESSDIGDKRTKTHGEKYNLTSDDKFTVFTDNFTEQYGDVTGYAKRQVSASGITTHGGITINVDPGLAMAPNPGESWGDLISLDMDGGRPTISDPTDVGVSIYYIGHEFQGTRTGVKNTIPEFETLGTIRDYYKNNQEFLNVAANARQRHFREAHIKKCHDNLDYAKAYGCACHTGDTHDHGTGTGEEIRNDWIFWKKNTYRYLEKCNPSTVENIDGNTYAGKAFDDGVTYIKIPDDRKFHDERVYKLTDKTGGNLLTHDWDQNLKKITGKGNFTKGNDATEGRDYKGCYNRNDKTLYNNVPNAECGDVGWEMRGVWANREQTADWFRTEITHPQGGMQPSNNPGGAYNFNKDLNFDN